MLLQHHDRHHDHQSSSFPHPKEGYAVPMSSVEPTGISGSIAYCLSDGAATGSASDPRANFAAQASVLLVLALHRLLLDLGADDGSNVVHRSGQFHVVNSMTACLVGPKYCSDTSCNNHPIREAIHHSSNPRITNFFPADQSLPPS